MDYAFSGVGRLYIREADGLDETFEDMYEVQGLGVKIAEQVVALKSKSNLAGGDYNSFSRNDGVTGSFTAFSWTTSNLLKFLRAQATSIAAGTATGVTYTAKKGKLIRLNGFIDPDTVVVTNAAGTVTYTPGTDYRVSGAGLLIPVTSTIADDTEIKLDCTYGAQEVISILNQAQKVYTLVFDGMNQANSGDPCVVDMYRVKIGLPADLALQSDDQAGIKIEFQILYDAAHDVGGDSAFLSIRRNVKA